MIIEERLAKETAREYALRILTKNIVMLELLPGTLLSEKEISIELGLSRTPVREALIELSKSQIVEIYPQRGSCISLIDNSLVEEAGFLRLVLEKAIIEEVCKYAEAEDFIVLGENISLQKFYLNNPSPNKLIELDNQFHRELFKIAKKQHIYSLMNSMSMHFDRVRSISVKSIKDIKIVDDHEQILNAIKERDVEKGIEMTIKHLSRYKVQEEELQEKYPAYFKK